MARLTRVSVLTLVTASCLIVYGCSGSNDAPTNTGNPNTNPPAAGAPGAAGSPGVAGSPAAAGADTGAAGSGVAGAATGAAGAGTAGSGAGAAGAGSSMAHTPLCAGLTTAAMGTPAPTKGGACTATDPQLCYKTCGPQSSGFKSETCTNGLYAESSGCDFDDNLDATCFKLPAAGAAQDAACPTTAAPKASDMCTVKMCTACNLGGGATGTYLDSTGAQKTGYCVCGAPKADGTPGKWSCGSTDAWPCPGHMGC